MTLLSFALLVLVQAAQVPATQPAAAGGGAAPTSQPAYDTGPLKAEVVAVMEVRRWAEDPAMAARMQTGLQFQTRIRGEKLPQLVRYGNLIFSELKDDAGQSLLDADTYSAVDKYVTRPSPYPGDRMREMGLSIMSRVKPSSRGSKTMNGRGSVRLIFAKESEKVTIINPAQYAGKVIDHPRLKELEIEIEIAAPEKAENMPSGERALIIDYKAKSELVQGVTFANGAMKAMMARDTWMNRVGGGDPLQVFRFEGPDVNDEMQMIVEFHPQVEDVKLPVELKDFALP